jgi:acyl-CoA synthetase (AMP-forming)/AMP-acid ligase II
MSPLTFLARPSRWLWAIHQHRGTASAAPNFAYELCVNKVEDEEIEGLDLSSWRMALNGAEPVSPEAMRRFMERYSRYGFRPEAMMPVYGLAENSLAVAFPPPGRPPRVDTVQRETFQDSGRAVPAAADDSRALRFVSCGTPLPDHEVGWSSRVPRPPAAITATPRPRRSSSTATGATRAIWPTWPRARSTSPAASRT